MGLSTSHDHHWTRLKAFKDWSGTRLILFRCYQGCFKIEDHFGGAVTETVYPPLQDTRLDHFVPREGMFTPEAKIVEREE